MVLTIYQIECYLCHSAVSTHSAYACFHARELLPSDVACFKKLSSQPDESLYHFSSSVADAIISDITFKNKRYAS